MVPHRLHRTRADAPEETAADTNDDLGAEGDESEDEDNTRADNSSNGGGAPDRETDDMRTRRRAWRPSAIGLTVLVPVGVKELEAVVTWGDYRTEPPMERFLLEAHDDPNKPDTREAPEVQWVRTPRREAVKVSIPDGRAEKSILVPNSETPQLPGGALELAAHARPYAVKMPDDKEARFQAVTIFLVNRRKRPRRRYEDVAFAFQARLELICPDGFVPRVDISGYATDDFDRRVADLHYADSHEFAVGRNTSAQWPHDVAKCTWVATCPLPTSEVERVAPKDDRELPGVEFDMEALAQLAATDATALSAKLEPLSISMRNGSRNRRRNSTTSGTPPTDRQAARRKYAARAWAHRRWHPHTQDGRERASRLPFHE